MNNERRKLLSKAEDLIAEAKALIEQACEEERDYFDAMPESLQQGDKGQRAEEVIGDLETAADELEDLCNRCSDAQQ